MVDVSRDIYVSPKGAVAISAYVGPVREDDGMRRRYQVTVISDQDGKHHSASLRYEDFHQMVEVLRLER